MLSFAFNPELGETPQTLQERRLRAAQLANQIGQGAPSYGGGIGDLFRGIGAGLSRYKTNKMQKAGDAGARSGMDKLMSIMYGGTGSQAGIAGQPGDVLSQASKSIAGIESGGKYDALGPTTRTGDRAYGKYQVMGANIPDWTEAALGQRLTPEEFLAMPGAQEKVFEHRFGGYLKENSPQDAASMWFTGKPLAQGAGLKDSLGTSGQGYADKFMAGMGGGGGMPMVPQLATYTPPQPQPAGGPTMPQQAPPMPPQAQMPQPAADMAPAQPPAMAQMQPANGDAVMVPQIMEMLRNPFITEQDRAFLQNRLEDIQKKQDPAYQMELEKSQLELEAMKNPGPDYEIVNGKDGSVFRVDKRTGKFETLYGSQPDNYRPLTAEEAAKYGLPPDGHYQIGPDNKVSEIGGGGTTVNIDQKAEGAFDKELAIGSAKAFNTMAEEGLNARADIGIINELETALASNGGTGSGIASVAAKYGLGGEGMSDIQAANALINKLVPTQRQPGSGTMSDRDVEMFKLSLPSLWNAPGGNAKIINVMKGLAAYKQAQGDIADQVLMGEISRQEARKMLRELPNPLARAKNNDDPISTPGKSDKSPSSMSDEEILKALEGLGGDH